MALKPEARRERLAMARRFEAGSLSKNEFCRREGISGCKLNYWLRHLEDERSRGIVDADFVEVVVTDSTSRSERVTCEVELPHGVKLRFFGSTE